MDGRGALIVGAAPDAQGGDHYAGLITRAPMLVAADGGLLSCLAAGRVPDLCVGDFDSTPPEALARAAEAGAEIIRYPTAKDASDLELAILAVRDRGRRPVAVCAAFTGRADHTLAALGTLMSAADLGAYADERSWVAVALDAAVRPSCHLEAPVGSVLSVLAFGGSAEVSSEGLLYPLERTRLSPFASLGLSNVSNAPLQTVTVHEGAALVFVDRTGCSLPLQSPLAITDTV